MKAEFRRLLGVKLEARLQEPVRLMQILAGPRQVGKTTLITQVLSDRPATSFRMIAADPQALPQATSGAGSNLSTLHLPPSAEWLQAE
jgi:predicted AAA+ superfamily ATPase